MIVNVIMRGLISVQHSETISSCIDIIQAVSGHQWLGFEMGPPTVDRVNKAEVNQSGR